MQLIIVFYIVKKIKVMAKNYNEAVHSKEKRQLTAKGNKFLWRCIEIVGNSKGLHKYSPEIKEIKEKLTDIIKHLLIDKDLTIEQVKELIKQSNFKLE